MTIDVTVVLNLHAEGDLAAPSLRSLQRLVDHTRRHGMVTETIAVLDDPDAATLAAVEQNAHVFDAVHTFGLRDLGRVRNAVIATAEGMYVACLDGDDLWCEDWITAAVRCARAVGDARTVWHPQFVQFFDPGDVAVQSSTATPSARAATYVMEQPETTDPHFDRRVLLVDNLWTSNVLAPRTLHLDVPYPPSDPARGLGIEDWSWNLATVWAGVAHRTVPDSVHMIRMKTHGSLARENAAFGLLPYLPEGAHLLA